MAAAASKPVKVKCTLSVGKKIKVFISDLMTQAHCLYGQKVKIERKKVNKIRSLELSGKWHTCQQLILIPLIALNIYFNHIHGLT